MTAVNDRGVEDAAILLMSLGEDDASEVLRQLASKVVHRIGEAITRLRSVPRERVDDVVTRFVDRARSENYLVPDPDAYVRNLLTKALGDEKARFMIERILHGSDTSGIDSLKWMEPEAVAELLRNEHPQIVAALLAHLDPEQSSDVLKLFSERARHEVLVRLATLEGIKPSALADLNEVMIKSLSGVENRRKSNLGGIKVTAEVINLLGTALEARARAAGENVDADLMNNVVRGLVTGGEAANVMLHVPYDRELGCRNEPVVLTGQYFYEKLAIAYNETKFGDKKPVPAYFRFDKVGVENDSISDFYLSGIGNGQLVPNMVRYANVKAAIAGMAAGEVDAVMGPLGEIEAMLPDEGFGVHTPPLPGLARSQWTLGVAVRFNWRDVSYAVDDALRAAVEDGRMAAIFAAHGLTWTAPEW